MEKDGVLWGRVWALCSVLALGACATAGGRDAGTNAPEPVPAEFRPVSYHSRLHHGDSRYPTLFSQDSFAIWVDDEVAELKKEKARESGEPVDASLEQAAALIGENYYVFECHFESAFPDASIAYDVVGLRNIDLVLLTPNGDRLRPIQRVMDTHADQSEDGAIKVFRRINIVVFPKRDIISGAPTISGDLSGFRLGVEGFHSDFYFEWEAVPPAEVPAETEETGRRRPSETEAYRAVRVGFSELFEKLRVLAKHTH